MEDCKECDRWAASWLRLRDENERLKVLKCRNCHWVNGEIKTMCIYCEHPIVKAERDKYKAALEQIAQDMCPRCCDGAATRTAEDALQN